jgi:hypothetical protein
MKPQTLPTAMNDLKLSSMDSEKGEAMLVRPCHPRNRPLVTAFGVVALCYLVWSATFRYNVFHHICGNHKATPVMNNQERALVPLEAHIMSKCPDAKVRFVNNMWITNLTFHRTVLKCWFCQRCNVSLIKSTSHCRISARRSFRALSVQNGSDNTQTNR